MLESLYKTFNGNYPEDYFGHSLSVSDVVALKREGTVIHHYVDNIGFKEVLDFGQSTYDHDRQQNDGTVVKKTSVLDRLNKFREEAREEMIVQRSEERSIGRGA